MLRRLKEDVLNEKLPPKTRYKIDAQIKTTSSDTSTTNSNVRKTTQDLEFAAGFQGGRHYLQTFRKRFTNS